MPDYTEGIMKDVAEIKFLIHDLRVEKTINEVIHFHVTLNTDLELSGVDQAKVLHGHDVQVLKEKAVSLRRAYQDYSNAVRNFSPDRTVLNAGRNYVETIYSACELILSPLWGRVDKVLTFLPPDSRSAKERTHYLNCIHWINGVYYRILQFLDEQKNKNVCEDFDVAAEIEDFTRDVAYSYVMEHSGGRVQIELARLDPAVIAGNLPRFRRMYFNLVMNAVDAMSNRDVGLLTVSVRLEGEQAVLLVRDNGSGMSPEKITQLLTDKETLDGELHSLGFVFVRQTIHDLGGELSIESEVGKGTTLKIRFSAIPGKQVAPRFLSMDSKVRSVPRPVGRLGGLSISVKGRNQTSPVASGGIEVTAEPEPPAPAELPATDEPLPAGESKPYGRLILRDYELSDSQYPGAIFAISVTDQGETDLFSHRPYEKYWSVQHEDLTPMFFEVVVRGRLEPDEEKRPTLTLKAPQNMREYFEYRNVAEQERKPELFARMVHDEYIRVARKLVETGIPPETGVLVDRLQKFFPEDPDLVKTEPFSLGLLACQHLSFDLHMED